MASLKELKIQFLEYIEVERGRALRTVENYDYYISRYIDFAKINKPEDITADSVREFRLWLNRQPSVNKVRAKGGETMSRATQNYHMIALRMFLRYLSKRGIKSLNTDQIELAKTSDRMLELITPEELDRFLKAPSGTDVKSLRDKAIIEMLFSTGLRVSELCSLPREINPDSEEISVRGKGGKVRVVFVSPQARLALKKYLAARTDFEEGLFVSVEPSNLKKAKKESDGEKNRKKKYVGKQHKNLDRRSIERIVKHYAIKAGISKKITPHTMRHMFATDLLSNGADIRSVQTLLGHSSISTTQIYTHVTDKHLRDIHKKYHGRRNS